MFDQKEGPYIKAQCLTVGRMPWTMLWHWPGKQERWDSIILFLNSSCNLWSFLLKPFYPYCQIVRGALQNDLKIMCKSSSVDLVTKIDQNVEQLIITSVKEKFPEHRYFVLHTNTGSEDLYTFFYTQYKFLDRAYWIWSKGNRPALLLCVSVSLVRSQWLRENLVFWLETQHGLLTLWMGPLTLCMGNFVFILFTGAQMSQTTNEIK